MIPQQGGRVINIASIFGLRGNEPGTGITTVAYNTSKGAVVNMTGLFDLQECNFVAVGMCGVFTAVMRAPLTGIFLIAEVTGGEVR